VSVQPYNGCPYVYVCQPPFQAQIGVASKHVNLFLYRLLLVYSLVVGQYLYPQIYYGDVTMLKIVYPICCGFDVHKSFVFACIAATDEKGITTYLNLVLVFLSHLLWLV